MSLNAAMCSVLFKKREKKIRMAQDGPYVKPGQNKVAVEIHRDMGHNAQHRDCPR